MNSLRLFLATFAFAFFAQTAFAQEAALPSIVVLADSSLTAPLAELSRAYSREANVAVVFSPAGPQVESQLITEGSAADVLITAKGGIVQTLKQQGLVDVYSEVTVASDRLVLAGPPGVKLAAGMNNGFPTAALLAQMGAEPVFVIGSPETLVEGSFAREALRKLDAETDFEPYTLYPKQRRQLYSAINKNGAYGLLLASDAKQQGVNILGVLPEKSYTPIAYKAVVIAGENMNQARKFVEYLKSEAARKRFSENGFSY